MTQKTPLPAILAPAGDTQSFLAALSAGADAVYCGLKHFSARMKAENFSLTELARLADLARAQGTSVYIAMNTLLKPRDVTKAGRLMDRLSTSVRPDGIIVQDLALPELARQVGFSGQIHLSTLANVSMVRSMNTIHSVLGVDRVILPREFSIDEMRAAADSCPPGLDLEVFVHGALCYGISGRCYWSSFLGGKSGLRGRCVQPCRRFYEQDRKKDAFFSCLDLSLDVLAKTLLDIPRIRAWKIEGRKKGPHYVFYTIKAYQLFRDHPGDPQAKKDGLGLLDQALGRERTRSLFLPQKPVSAVQPGGTPGSGLIVSRVGGPKERQSIRPKVKLLPGDLLRVGMESDPWHRTIPVRRAVPKGGTFNLPGRVVPKSTPVFLVDRREPELMAALTELEKKLVPSKEAPARDSTFDPVLPAPSAGKGKPSRITVYRNLQSVKVRGPVGHWLAPGVGKRVSKTLWPKIQWWLPPVIWPNEEAEFASLVDMAVKRRSRSFVCNAPWQISLFQAPESLDLWAGPFCNTANPLALKTLQDMGFTGAVISPELGREELLALPPSSPLPLGIVLSGVWPLCLSRIEPGHLDKGKRFTSPKGEGGWTSRHGQNTWVFPDWKLDLSTWSRDFQQAGFSLLIHLQELVPRGLSLKNRPGLWNLEHGLL